MKKALASMAKEADLANAPKDKIRASFARHMQIDYGSVIKPEMLKLETTDAGYNLLVDDHAVVRQGLRLFLGLDPLIDVIGEAANGEEALTQVAALHPDVVIMDLPGIYSLSPYTLEEVVSRNYLITERPDAILNLIDGTNLERNLYLTTQLTELGIPVVVAVNMMDVVRKNGDQINVAELSRELGCEIVEISALKGDGVMQAAEAAVKAAKSGKTIPMHTFSGPVEHAIAHIELNAIDLAWDAVYRFRGLPAAFYADWVQVAHDESRHFVLLRNRLREFGHDYGDFDAHNGLWEMTEKTAHDGLARMALVPRVLEARGLDVTPGMIVKLRELGDEATVAILDLILQEEVAHVAAGSRWFRWYCEQRGVEPRASFRELLKEYAGGYLHGPFNIEARLLAGFDEDELAALEAP